MRRILHHSAKRDIQLTKRYSLVRPKARGVVSPEMEQRRRKTQMAALVKELLRELHLVRAPAGPQRMRALAELTNQLNQPGPTAFFTRMGEMVAVVEGLTPYEATTEIVYAVNDYLLGQRLERWFVGPLRQHFEQEALEILDKEYREQHMFVDVWTRVEKLLAPVLLTREPVADQDTLTSTTKVLIGDCVARLHQGEITVNAAISYVIWRAHVLVCHLGVEELLADSEVASFDQDIVLLLDPE